MALGYVHAGPSKMDLMLAVFDHRISRREIRQVTFEIEMILAALPTGFAAAFGPVQQRIACRINGVSPVFQDPKGETWILKVTGNSRNFTLRYNTTARRGEVEDISF